MVEYYSPNSSHESFKGLWGEMRHFGGAVESSAFLGDPERLDIVEYVGLEDEMPGRKGMEVVDIVRKAVDRYPRNLSTNCSLAASRGFILCP